MYGYFCTCAVEHLCMTQSTVLGVSTLTYLPYCVFNYISPLMSIIIAAIGYKIYRKAV